ncbi:tetratricopeptide repeat protein [Nostoc sp.]|uniref:tetratricopeptide repeat protein n=1 Tax=Nostoc sp. TaxID=1180 RepID=UPI002FFB2FDA
MSLEGVAMQGRINGISSHYLSDGYGDDLSELIDNSYYDSSPSDGLDFIDEDECEESINSVDKKEVDKFPQLESPCQQNTAIKTFINYFNLGVDRRQRGDQQGAIMAWNEALSLNYNNAHTYYYRGITKAEIGNYDGAVEDLKQALYITPKYLNAKRQLEKIRQDLLGSGSTILPLKPNNPTQHYQRGRVRFHFGEYQEAIKEFNQALQINPNLVAAYYSRGKSYYKLKKKEEAIKDFQTSAKLFCENNQPDKLAKWTPFELGESNREEAISYLIPYLSKKSSYDEKRLAASAIHKLANSYKNISALVIRLLLDNLTYPAPQVRQYTLKALSLINLPKYAFTIIQEIANSDLKSYNRNLAKAILENFNSVPNREFKHSDKSKPDNRYLSEKNVFNAEESDNSYNQGYFPEEAYDTSMDYGYVDDLSNPEDYLYNY